MRSTHREIRCSVLAYWKFESISLQRRVRVSHRPGRCRSRTAPFARVCAPRLTVRSAETRRIEQYRAKEHQYLCGALFQYRAVV